MRSRFVFAPVLAVLLVFLGAIVSSAESQFIISRTYKISYVVDSRQVDYIVDIFKNRLLLEDRNAGIAGCNHVTRVSLEGDKYFSVGAACEVHSGNSRFLALMCADSRFGRLVHRESNAPAREDVIQFTERNCLTVGRR